MNPVVLDEQAKQVLRALRPGDRFTLRDEKGIFQAVSWEHPVEAEPWVRAYKYEGAFGLTASRSIRVSRIDAIVTTKGAA